MAANGTCTPAALRAGLHALESLMFGVTCRNHERGDCVRNGMSRLDEYMLAATEADRPKYCHSVPFLSLAANMRAQVPPKTHRHRSSGIHNLCSGPGLELHPETLRL